MINETLACELKECQGELEKIAETKKEGGWSGTMQTLYLECSSCNQLYKLLQGTRSKYIDKDGNITEAREFKDLYLYDGLLTKEQLIKYAPKNSGKISPKREKKLIEREEQ